MTLYYRPSYDNEHRCHRVVRVRDGVEHTLAARFPDAQAALRAIGRLEELHGLVTAPETTEEEYEDAYPVHEPGPQTFFWRQVAIGGEWDDDEAPF